MKELRKTERRTFQQEIFAYIEGARLDTVTHDISAGGAFCPTPENVPIGAAVAVVFRKQAELREAVFLVGRVVRRQTAPIPGVGIRWTKATSQAAPAELKWFLSSLLGLSDPKVLQERETGRWEMLSVFRFPDAGDSSETPRPKSAPRAATACYPAGKDAGTLTTRISKAGLRAPASLPVTLVWGADELHLHITFLGATGLFAQGEPAHVPPGETVHTRFEIPAEGKNVEVMCRCRVVELDDGSTTGTPGLDLDILSLDEGKRPGILKQYVRWLHFQALAAS